MHSGLENRESCIPSEEQKIEAISQKYLEMTIDLQDLTVCNLLSALFFLLANKQNYLLTVDAETVISRKGIDRLGFLTKSKLF